MRASCRAFALLLLGPAFGFVLAAQTPGGDFFIQLADPQFGAFTSDREFAQETANYEFVVDNINRLHPSFVVICGDLINRVGDSAQAAEYFRITTQLGPEIAVYSVPGNHDVGNEPTPDTLDAYRRSFGPDYYSFEEAGIYGIVLNSSLIAAPGAAEAEARRQEEWLVEELEVARSTGSEIVVFQHHPWFLRSPDEPTEYFNIPIDQRRRYLGRLKDAGVRYVFAGHYHRNAFGTDGDLEMITSGPVGRPLGDDPSGLRVVTIHPDGLQHEYYGLGMIPNQIP